MTRLSATLLGVFLLLGGVCHHAAQHPAAPHAAVVFAGPASPVPAVAPTLSPAPSPLPPSVFIKVPYTVQAPLGNWDAAHEDYCEAAAVLMYGAYLQGDHREVIPPREADQRMAAMVAWERQSFPHLLNLPLPDVGQVGAHFFNATPLFDDATLPNIERVLAAGHPVIIPLMTHGAPGGLKINQYYGTLNVYHVLLITGYGPGYLVTNDAGIGAGENWRYTWTVLDAAMQAQAPVMNQQPLMLYFS